MLVADTNVLIELFLPSAFCEVVLACRDADDDWRLPSLWLPEFRHVLLKFLLAGRLFQLRRRIRGACPADAMPAADV
jgi:predicted nucleic acid-binding protein